MRGSNVRVAFTRVARTAGDSARTTSGRRKNTESRAERTQRLRLLLQAFLLVLSSFLFSFFFSHRFLFSGSSAQCNHHARIVRMGNQVFARALAKARASSSLLTFLTLLFPCFHVLRLFILFKYRSLLACFFLDRFKKIFLLRIK